MPDIKYKRLEPCDIKNIVIDYPKDELEKFLENEDHYLFVGMKDHEVIANVYGYGMLRPDGRNMFYIHSVDVLPEYQSNGIGTNLMNYILEYIRSEKKYYKFFVLADTDNVKACKLYQKYAKCDEQVLFSNEILL